MKSPYLSFVYAATLMLLSSATLAEPSRWEKVERIVVFGDLHGDYDQYLKLLKQNDLVDQQLRWKGGKTHLVQLGDVPDRGADSLRIIRHLMQLQKEAAKTEGVVHALVGNHEAMNILGDLSYVHPGEYAALVTRRSDKLQRDYHRKVYLDRITRDPTLAENRDTVMAQIKTQYPPGYVEHRVLWQPGGHLAKWVASNPAVIRINRTLFCHGGINPRRELLSVEAINTRITSDLRGASSAAENLAMDEDGPLWYRGLARGDAAVDQEAVQRMLAFYDVDRIVIAHTPTRGRVITRFGGRVVLADTGVSTFYGGHTVNLVIEGEALYSQSSEGRTRVAPDANEVLDTALE